MSHLFISGKNKLKQQLGVDFDTAMRQIENWAQLMENYLGVSIPPPTSDVPIGGVVSFTTGPSTNTSYTTMTTIFTATANLIAGHKYLLSCNCNRADQITNASTNSSVFVSDSSALIIGGNGGFLRAFAGVRAVGEVSAGGATTLLSPTTTAVDTFTVSASTSAASLTVFANSAQLLITRVA